MGTDRDTRAELPLEAAMDGPATSQLLVGLGQVPASGAETIELAAQVRHAALGPTRRTAPLLDLTGLCAAARCDVTVRPLRAAQGGVQALLVPKDERFELAVDPEPPGGWSLVPSALQQEVARHRLRFRVAHELAHALFFAETPRGIERRTPNSADQERFCDEFAAELLLPSVAASCVAPTPAAVVTLHRRYDVSLALAARALAAAHPRMACWLVVVRNGAALLQWRSKASYEVDIAVEEAAALAHESLVERDSVRHVQWRDGARCRLHAHGLASRSQALILASPI